LYFSAEQPVRAATPGTAEQAAMRRPEKRGRFCDMTISRKHGNSDGGVGRISSVSPKPRQDRTRPLLEGMAILVNEKMQQVMLTIDIMQHLLYP
jgi:hypothetical protein